MKRKPIVSALLLALFGAASVANSAHAASYEVQELPLRDVARSYFSVSLDNEGTALVNVRNVFNTTIDLSLIDLDPIPLVDRDAAEAGNFVLADYENILSILRSQSLTIGLSGVRSSSGQIIRADDRLQKVAQDLGYKINNGNDVSYVNGFDTETIGSGGFTRSLNTRLEDSALGEYIVGNMPGPFSRIDHVNESGEDEFFIVNKFIRRAFVQVGNSVTELTPDNTDAGGYSEAYEINENLQVAGVSSVASSENIRNSLAVCADDEQRGDQPVDVCNYTIFNQVLYVSNYVAGGRFSASELELKPTVWQLDTAGNVISKQLYDGLYAPDEFNSLNQSRGLDLNNAGVMVGFSSALFPDRINPEPTAVIFEEGKTTRISEDEDFRESYATQINDNNYVVGYVDREFNGVDREKLFIFNRNTNVIDVIQGFFVSSVTIPRALNNNNIVVGDAESDASTSSTSRPRVGFMYDIENDIFTDLNTLLPCDSPYKIISGVDINDDNEIIADAFVSQPRRDELGNIRTDENGVELESNTVISVLLNPTGNAPSDCANDSNTRERQGASLSLWLAVPLILLGFYRRFKR